MALALKSHVGNYSSGAVGETVTVTTAADTAVGDVLLCLHAKDYYTATTSMTTPTGTAGTWTQRAFRDTGTNYAKIKAWTRTVTVAGAQTVTIPAPDDAARCNVVLVLSECDDTDPIPVNAGGGSTANSATLTSPTVTPPVAGSLLVVAYMTGGRLFANSNITPNGTGPVTELIELDTGYSTMSVGTLALPGTGATGAKTAACSPSDAYASLSLIVRPGAPVASGPEPGRALLAA